MALAIKRPGDIPLSTGNHPAYYANLAFGIDDDPLPREELYGLESSYVGARGIPYAGIHLVIAGRAQTYPNVELDVVEYDPADVVRAEYHGGHPCVRMFTMTSFDVVDVLPPFTVAPLFDPSPYVIEWDWESLIMVGTWRGEYGLPVP